MKKSKKAQAGENIINACFKLFEAWAKSDFELKDRVSNSIFAMLEDYDHDRREKIFRDATRTDRQNCIKIPCEMYDTLKKNGYI